MAALENIFELETDVFGHGIVKLNGRDLSMVVSGVDIHIEAGVVTDVRKQRKIGDYIHFYNYQRIQLKTKLTPMEYRCQFVS